MSECNDTYVAFGGGEIAVAIVLFNFLSFCLIYFATLAFSIVNDVGGGAGELFRVRDFILGWGAVGLRTCKSITAEI